MSNRLAFQTQLASIMEALANAAVAEICKLVDDDYAVVRLQMTQCQTENKILKRKLHLLELKMARGTAERRLRESVMNRPRVQIHTGDRLRQSPPSSDGVFHPRMDMGLWSERAAAGNTPAKLIHSNNVVSQCPDVELVEPEAVTVKEEKVEPNGSEEEKAEPDVQLIGDDGVVDCIPFGAAGSILEHQDSQSTSCQLQHLSGTQSRRMKRSGGGGISGGVESEEEPDVVLVKVEEGTRQTSLSIQEGLVESSTDNYRGVQPFDDTSQSSVNPLPDEQERASDVSEVSHGHALLWTAGGGGYCQDGGLPGPSSRCVPVPFLPAAQPGAELGSVRALAAQSSKGRGLTENCRRYFQETPLINLPQESRPIQALGLGPQQFLDSSPQRVPKKKLCVCRFCSKVFSSPANLESHLRTHTGERPYGCTICGKKFSQFWNLKIHKNIHTGERPYQCSLCAERFSDPSNLKKHQKRHHPQT